MDEDGDGMKNSTIGKMASYIQELEKELVIREAFHCRLGGGFQSGYISAGIPSMSDSRVDKACKALVREGKFSFEPEDRMYTWEMPK